MTETGDIEAALEAATRTLAGLDAVDDGLRTLTELARRPLPDTIRNIIIAVLRDAGDRRRQMHRRRHHDRTGRVTFQTMNGQPCERHTVRDRAGKIRLTVIDLHDPDAPGVRLAAVDGGGLQVDDARNAWERVAMLRNSGCNVLVDEIGTDDITWPGKPGPDAATPDPEGPGVVVYDEVTVSLSS